MKIFLLLLFVFVSPQLSFAVEKVDVTLINNQSLKRATSLTSEILKGLEAFRGADERTHSARLISFHQGWKDVHERFPSDGEAYFRNETVSRTAAKPSPTMVLPLVRYTN